MSQASKIYVIANVTILCIEIVTIFYCYGCLIRELYFSNRVYPQTERDSSSEKKKLVVTLMLAATPLLISFAPLVAFYTFIATRNGEQLDIDYELYSNLVGVFDFNMIVFSLCFNPIIYGFRTSKFREQLKNQILCRRPSPQNAYPWHPRWLAILDRLTLTF